MIRNPILPGFNPDPSICRVGDDYFIATSTFEWYPGVQIHHSTNLVDWALITRPLRRAAQLDMRGNPDSCGVWAPCLSFADDKFWLVYTDVKRFDGNFKDAHNYIVTADTIDGEWSDPIYMNSSGFDPSLFHDDDGRKWFLNMIWNHRASGLGQSPLNSPFGGIVMQEYDHAGEQLIGKPRLIFTGSPRGLAEAPHIFKRDGYYYLVTAEGGTGYEHAVTHARSKVIAGPYELHPDHHVITADYADNGKLQRTGHGQTVETPNGQWYHTYLCSRPLPGTQRSPLGRETGISLCHWGEDAWLRLSDGGQQVEIEVAAPTSSASSTLGISHAEEELISRRFNNGNVSSLGNDAVNYDFSETSLPIDFQWLRTPDSARLFSLQARSGYLRLFGRESPGSFFEQSLLARRLQHHHVAFDTTVEFSPGSFQQSAGLIAYYNRHKFHYLQVTHDESLGRVLSIMSCDGDWPESRLNFPLGHHIELPAHGAVSMRCQIMGASLQFSYSLGPVTDSVEWTLLDCRLDASVLSDEGGRGEHASFTGCFVGMLCFDTSGGALAADFSHFNYQPQ